LITLVPIRGIAEIVPGDCLADILAAALAANDLVPRNDDVLVVTSKIVSKAEDRFRRLDRVTPSDAALDLSARALKDPRLVQLVLEESTAIVRVALNVIIARHRLGLVMANAGIDASNLGRDRADQVLLLPSDPDASARALADALERVGSRPAVVISDSFGRPWRMGVVNVAVGVSGLPAIVDRRGERDRDGRELEVTQVAFADMIASAAGLVSGEAAEGVPAVLMRGWTPPAGDAPAVSLVRPVDQDLFL